MKHGLKKAVAAAAAAAFLSLTCFAQSVYTVKPGDSMWKIAVKYQIGLSELKQSNPQIRDYSKIMPGQKITIPAANATISSMENKVIALVNQERAKRGLQTLTTNWQLSRVARYKSQDMASKHYFSHISPTYGSPFKMMENFGIRRERTSPWDRGRRRK